MAGFCIFFSVTFIINTQNLSSGHSQNTFLFSLYPFAAQHNWTIEYYGNLNFSPYYSTRFILTVHPRKSPADEVSETSHSRFPVPVSAK